MDEKQATSQQSLIPQERVESRILVIRGHKVMLDRDLAELYGVETAQLKRQVKRNMDRFPDDFMFVLNKSEFANWRCQFGASNKIKMGLRYAPMAFTEHGILMLSSVLNSHRAIHVNIQIMRAFVKLRELMISHKDLAQKINELERKFNQHDKDILIIFETLKRLMSPPKEPIGFRP
jgi:hypothetical protein